MPGSEEKNKNRILELDAMRGLATILVLVFHFTVNHYDNVGFELGSTGVQLFFMISGFVIYMTLQRSENAGDFIIRRVSRLYPAYWVIVSITFAAHLVINYFRNGNPFHEVTFKQYLCNLTMFQFYFSQQSLDGQYWTLLVEMLFYALVVLLFSFRPSKNIAVSGTVLSVFFALCFNLFYNPTQSMFYWVPLTNYLPLFIAGIVFFRMYEGDKSFLNYLLCFFCFLSTLMLYKYNVYVGISRIQYSIMILLYFILFFMLVKGRAGFLINKPFLFFGKISYTFYLLHDFIFAYFLIDFLVERARLPVVGSIFISLGASILASAALSHWLEFSLSRKLKTLLKRLFL